MKAATAGAKGCAGAFGGAESGKRWHGSNAGTCAVLILYQVPLIRTDIDPNHITVAYPPLL